MMILEGLWIYIYIYISMIYRVSVDLDSVGR